MENEKRRSGRTTRMIDEMVQELFTNGSVGIRDHHATTDMRVLQNLRNDNMKKILNRLASEHHLTVGKGLYRDGDWLILTHQQQKQ